MSQFCQVNYGVTFLLAKKGMVVKNEKQNEVYRWLSDTHRNGWNNHEPDWNFIKYLIDKRDMLMQCFGPAILPVREEVIAAVKGKN